MNKGVLIGGAAGILVLALLGGYLLTHAPQDAAPAGTGTPGIASGTPGATNPGAGAALPGATTAPSAAGMPSETTSTMSGAMPSPPPGAVAAGQPDGTKAMSRAERRAIRAAVNERMKALTAKGDKLTIAEIQAEMDQIEAMGKGMYDKVYFDGMREILTQVAEIQKLNHQLAAIKDEKGQSADQQRLALLAQIKERSASMTMASAKLQQYALDLVKESQGGTRQ